MKGFILKILVFCSIVGIIFAGNYVFNSIQLKKAPNLSSTRTLVIGDSRMMSAINPSLIENCTNAAQNSESYFVSYHKLKYLLKHTSGIKTVIIGFSYPSFSAYMDGIFKDDVATSDVLNRIYPIVSLNDFGKLEVDEEKYYQILFKNLLVYPHTNHHKYMGGFTPLKPGIPRANLEATIQRHYFDKDSNNIGISFCASQYLDSIIDLTRNYGAELILVNAPLHKDYLDRIPQNFVDYYEEVKKACIRRNIKVLDYGHDYFEDKLYKDYNHLSLEGANELTERVKDYLLN